MSSPDTYDFVIDAAETGRRLDRFLADQDPPGLSRSQVKKAIDSGEILVNDAVVKAGHSLQPGDQIRWIVPAAEEFTAAPQPVDFGVLHEDDDLAIIDKPAGLVVHPAPGHPDQTLVNGLAHRFTELSSIGDPLRPGIVHRLDRDTTGALAVAKSDRAHLFLAAQFRDHSASRTYHALVFGPGLEDQGTFRTGHGRHRTHRIRYTGTVDVGRHAVTHYKVMERFDSGVCLVECRLETGRTHQIRMHFYEAHAPLLGDHLYGGRATSGASIIDRQALHARTLGINHPDGHPIEVTSPYPEDFTTALRALRLGADWR